ncbi:MAG: ABC transporter substrate-binding protein, partial [Pseudogulbenkiania sp.]|nr:ABC transporter substrate-binding protein [Pseudogulbenkiania sp.]
MNKYARLSLIAAAAITLVACGKQEQKAAEGASAPQAEASGEAVVKIGQVSPMTGPISHLGKDNEFGAQLAIEDL